MAFQFFCRVFLVTHSGWAASALFPLLVLRVARIAFYFENTGGVNVKVFQDNFY